MCVFEVRVCEYLLDVLSFLVLLAVVLLLAKCEELLLLLLLQLCEPLAALLIQITQVLVQGRQRVLGPTEDTHASRQTHSHTRDQNIQKLRFLLFQQSGPNSFYNWTLKMTIKWPSN